MQPYYKTQEFKTEAHEVSQRLHNTGEVCCFVIKTDVSTISAQQLSPVRKVVLVTLSLGLISLLHEEIKAE